MAEPKNIRREFAEASESGHIALTVCELQVAALIVVEIAKVTPIRGDVVGSQKTRGYAP